MRNIRQRGDLQFQARVTRKGHPPQSSTHNTRAEAEAWVRRVMCEMDQGEFTPRNKEVEKLTLGQALERYKAEVTSTKKGRRQEESMIDRWLKHRLASRHLITLSEADFDTYRKERLSAGKATNTVRLELALIRHLYETARKTWKMKTLRNPFEAVKLPGGSNKRERRLAPGEREIILAAIRDVLRNPWIEAAFVLAIETTLRQSMLLSLRWDWVDLERSIIYIPAELRATENKGVPSCIPIWPEAHKVFTSLPRSTDGRVLPISQNALNCCWKGLRNHERGAMFRDLRWHDLRHEGISKCFDLGMNVIEAQSISGHKSVQMLARYTHPRAENLLAKYGGAPQQGHLANTTAGD